MVPSIFLRVIIRATATTTGGEKEEDEQRMESMCGLLIWKVFTARLLHLSGGVVVDGAGDLWRPPCLCRDGKKVERIYYFALLTFLQEEEVVRRGTMVRYNQVVVVVGDGGVKLVFNYE